MRLGAGLPSVRGQFRIVTALGVDAVGSGLFLPFSILFFTATTPLTIAQVGLAISVSSGLALPLGPLLGSLTDRLGARRVLILGNLIQALGFFGYLFVGSFGALLLASFAVRLGTYTFWAAYPPLVTQISAPGERERWFGFLGALRNTGFAAGGLLAGLAVSTGGSTGYHAIVAVNAGSCLVAAALLTGGQLSGRRVRSAARDVGAWRTLLADRPYLGLALVNVPFATSTLALTVVMPVYAVQALGLPAWVPGAAFTVNCVLVAVGQGPVVAALTGRTRVRALQVACVFFIGSTLVMLAATAVPVVAATTLVLLGVVVFTGGELVDSPVMAALSSEAAPDSMRARYLSAYQLSWNVSLTIGPAVLTALLALGSFPAWGALALIGAAGLAGVTRLARHLPAASHRIGTVPTT